MKSSPQIELKFVDGVIVSSTAQEKFSDFEKSYLKVREKEKRVLSIEEIRKLPRVDEQSPDFLLWKIRQKNISRFLDFLSKKKKALRILDVGCGNGFFTHLMQMQGHQAIGVDVNLHELKQAAEAFNNSGVKWYYLDLMAETLPEPNFDVITFCGSFQYFKAPVELLNCCRKLLLEKGEIHIIDSPFYTHKTKVQASERSREYFQSLGAKDMIHFYNHNSLEVLSDFNFEFKFKPAAFPAKLFKTKDSPFPWIMIK